MIDPTARPTTNEGWDGFDGPAVSAADFMEHDLCVVCGLARGEHDDEDRAADGDATGLEPIRQGHYFEGPSSVYEPDERDR